MRFFGKLFGGTETQDASRQLVNDLSDAIRSGDREREREVRACILLQGKAISSTLAKEALRFDPDHLEDDHPGEKFYIARTTLGLIGEIGGLDEQSAQSLFNRFVRGRGGHEAQEENWGGVWSTAVDTLQKLGYKVVEPRQH